MKFPFKCFWRSGARRHHRTSVSIVRFDDEYSIKMWKTYFPKPLKSPVARSLSIGAANVHALRWVRSFTQLQGLSVDDQGWKTIPKPVSLAQLRGLSSDTLKTLRLIRHSAPLSEVFDFICSFPNLKDLQLDVKVPFETDSDLRTVFSTTPPKPGEPGNDSSSSRNTPSAATRLTGTLELNAGMNCEISSIVSKLLEVPGGLHFSRINIVCPVVTDKSATKLVSSCSDTLKSLRIEYTADPVISLDSPHKIDLSRATKLEDLEFRWNRPEVKWITRTLKSVARKALRRVTISLNPNFVLSVPTKEWYDLDVLLVKLQSKYSVTVSISCSDKLKERASDFLPVLRSFANVSHADDHPFRNYHDIYNLEHWLQVA